MVRLLAVLLLVASLSGVGFGVYALSTDPNLSLWGPPPEQEVLDSRRKQVADIDERYGADLPDEIATLRKAYLEEIGHLLKTHPHLR